MEKKTRNFILYNNIRYQHKMFYLVHLNFLFLIDVIRKKYLQNNITYVITRILEK